MATDCVGQLPLRPGGAASASGAEALEEKYRKSSPTTRQKLVEKEAKTMIPLIPCPTKYESRKAEHTRVKQQCRALAYVEQKSLKD